MELMESIFKIANLSVLPFWLTMIFFPKWKLTQFLLNYYYIAALLALTYAALILPDIKNILPMVAKPELQALIQGFQSPQAMTAGWIHYLVFDLLVGQSIFRRAQAQGTNSLIAGMTLFLTLMFGPIGWLVSLVSIGDHPLTQSALKAKA